MRERRENCIRINSFEIPFSELTFSYARSSGPGGQNVNKVNSKALLRWNVENSASISHNARMLIFSKLTSMINRNGELLISSDKFRDQLKNREDCIEKFKTLLTRALVVPKVRKKTKPSKSTKIKAKNSKAKHSHKKQMRRARHDLD